MKTIGKLWLGIGILALFSPLGLFLPEFFKAGSAWGEWGAQEVGGLVGYIPRGMQRLSSLWSAPLPEYTFPGWEAKALPAQGLAYLLSAVAGIAVTAGAAYAAAKLLRRKR